MSENLRQRPTELDGPTHKKLKPLIEAAVKHIFDSTERLSLGEV